ncbi:MAG: hypothetical protein M3Y87_37520, partial [Myxococcota bacterium]|nr:hypothetical protein [Myxococcota bacterium]
LVVLLGGTRALGDGRAWPWLVALGVLDRVVRPLALDHPLERFALGCVLGVGVALAITRAVRWTVGLARRRATIVRRLGARTS